MAATRAGSARVLRRHHNELAVGHKFKSEGLEPLHRSIILLVLLRLKLWRCAVRAILPRRSRRGLPRDWVTYINHVISKQLVALALRCQAGIRFEDLSGIRGSARQRKDAKSDAGQNRDYWPFCQLETFVRYKALAAGVAVNAVRPHYTSQTCHR